MKPAIWFLKNENGIHPDQVAKISQLRSRFDCLWMDETGIQKFNPQLQVAGMEKTRQPLRLIWTRLTSVNFDHQVYCDEFRRNTIVITTDQDIAENGEIAFKLEQLGIGLLTQGSDRTELKSVLKTLSSLKLKSLLIEGTFVSEKLFTDLNLIDVSLADATDPAAVALPLLR